MTSRLLIAAVVVVLVSSCNFDNGVTPQDGDVHTDSLVALVNGVRLGTSASVTASLNNGELIISGGIPDDRRIVLTLYDVSFSDSSSFPRTYVLASETWPVVGFAQYTEPLSYQTFRFYNTTVTGASGRVVITSFANRVLEGTFFFTARLTNGSGAANATISNGVFSATLQ